MAAARAGDPRARARGARRVGRLPRHRPARARPRRRRAATSGCRSSPPALRRLLEELPGARDGLARTERQLLAAVAAGARTREQAFVAAAANEEAPFLGDAIAFERLEELAAGRSRS